MEVQLKEWGNSQGIRFSKDVLREAGFACNDTLYMDVSDGVIVLSKLRRHKTLEERVAENGGKLNLNGEYDWGDPVGREIW